MAEQGTRIKYLIIPTLGIPVLCTPSEDMTSKIEFWVQIVKQVPIENPTVSWCNY